MNYYRFTTIWILIFTLSFVALSVIGIAPKNILSMNNGIRTSLTFTKKVSADEALPSPTQMSLVASVENSNIFLCGHSTSLTNVRNKAYEAFNDLGKLNIGDVIKIYANDKVYEYSVVSMSLAKADDALVTFSNEKKMLTLSTCNTFGKKEDRFVVTAVYIRNSV